MDDSLIFCKPKTEYLLNLRCILLCFLAVSGLKINLAKSEMVGFDVGNEMNTLVQIMGYQEKCFPITYLGYPLGLKAKEKRGWEPIIRLYDRRLASWKRGFLSKRGRLI